jgi:hypothetical protein
VRKLIAPCNKQGSKSQGSGEIFIHRFNRLVSDKSQWAQPSLCNFYTRYYSLKAFASRDKENVPGVKSAQLTIKIRLPIRYDMIGFPMKVDDASRG